ncbi:4-hydroxy-tetrahydrodipicolinate synthase [Paenibacillus sp. UMB4589-SE434]|uniref:4-hydroxy-tetrahydrodipicolinate synthase n=1 Tax=Paenibacillus sp. UMB4589-SE434 TaxID=3046314 RepID=UPI00254F4785|nr:4-hydroxy-tetrahydrodipicolinate synthase [Paenibacillus sp. UMB4589-SE434]MDK8180671.1 4-hydroxy-tetrahydrodipicolinate synthase [Paenibacillus sp. UMB4589-SE434]
MEFGRLITAMVTPFHEDLTINWQQAEQLIDYLIDVQRNDSLVICGTTGESPTLSDEEKAAMFRFAVEKARGRARIIAGTGSNNTAHSIHLTRIAEMSGVDGVLLVVPYYNKPNQEGMYQHFKAIAESTRLPVMLYNVPGRTGASISVDTTLRLARDVSNIVATKECVSIEQMSLIAAGAPASFRVYSGDDAATLPCLSVGGYGIVSVAAHLVGAQMKQMIESYVAGHVQEAVDLNHQLHPVFKGLFEAPHPVPNPVAVKYALQLIGYEVGSVRLPLVPASIDEQAFIRQLVQKSVEL